LQGDAIHPELESILSTASTLKLGNVEPPISGSLMSAPSMAKVAGSFCALHTNGSRDPKGLPAPGWACASPTVPAIVITVAANITAT
jgi:hypothetical protein